MLREMVLNHKIGIKIEWMSLISLNLIMLIYVIYNLSKNIPFSFKNQNWCPCVQFQTVILSGMEGHFLYNLWLIGYKSLYF